MLAKTRATTLREQVLAQKMRVIDIGDQLEELAIYERLTAEQRSKLDHMYRAYQRDYGAVAYQYWLRAVVKSMRPNIKNLNKVLVYELQKRGDTNKLKLNFLEFIAVQMGMSVTITSNSKSKSKQVVVKN